MIGGLAMAIAATFVTSASFARALALAEEFGIERAAVFRRWGVERQVIHPG